MAEDAGDKPARGGGRVRSRPPAAKRRRGRDVKVRGFVVPPTLKAADQRGLRDAVVDDVSMRHMSNNMPIAFTDDVPVGHLWHLGQLHGNMVYACYKTRDEQCHWKEVPSDDIPDWDPDGPQ